MQKIIGLLVGLVAFVILVVLAGFPHSPPPTQAVVGELIIDQSVSGSSTLGIVTAQKLVDTASATYFVDPAATGDSLVAAGKVTAGSFAGDGSLLTGISGIPAGLVSFFNLASCPTGWTELTTARGRVITGLPLSGTLAGTVGIGFTNLEDRTHTHTGPSHQHNMGIGRSSTTYNSSYYSQSGDYGQTTRTGVGVIGWSSSSPTTAEIYDYLTSSAGTGATSTAATSNVIPYIQLLACQKS